MLFVEWQCAAIFGHLAADRSVVKKPGQWNRMTIRCQGPLITVTLNGETVTKMDMRKWTSAKKNPDGSEIPGWLGGPLAMFLIRRYRLAAPAHGPAVEDAEHDEAETPRPISAASVIRIMMLLSVGVVVGTVAAEEFASVFRLPTFVWVLFVCIVLGNTARRLWQVNDATIDVVGNTALGVFLAITLMSLQLLQLVDLALPMLAMLLVQVGLALAFITLVTFRLMGRNYDSAVLCAGHCGFAMGATPTAVANIQAVTQHHGPSPLAFIIVPVVGGFIVDIANATIIQTFVSVLSG
jgi:ESS family glutamate:Na+ symporter